jgi:uncharacterized protein DUF4394
MIFSDPITESRAPAMIHTSRRRKLLAALAAALTALLVTASQARADDLSGLGDVFFKRLKVIGLTDDGRLVHFTARSPSKTRDIGFVNGLSSPDASLVGIDFRVQNGQLYGVGDGGGIYTIDTTNAKATLVSSLTVALDPLATSFGVDFNPAADRLRIIGDTGQNLAHDVNNVAGTVANGMLNYPPVPPATTPTTARGVTGAAYTNNDLPPSGASTATTLFDIDTMRDQVVIQSPPGNGILVATGTLGVDADSAVGFDIYSRLVGGVTVSNSAFASLLVNGTCGFYHIGLLTGKAIFLGTFDESVVDIAIPLNQ